MRFGIIGLGRMGRGLARNGLAHGLVPVGYNRTPSVTRSLVAEGLVAALSLEELTRQLAPPRVVMLYVHHEATEDVGRELADHLAPGDIALDGGNSHWIDSERRHAFFADAGIRFLDVGTSGGIEGARGGACFMVGGERDTFEVVRPILERLAADEDAVFYAGPPGAGHFVKLVHNAIEFGMVQAIAEGVELVARSRYEIDLASLLAHWNHGSVIRGWLLELAARGLADSVQLSQLSSYVEDTGEVKWMLNWAMSEDIPAPVIAAAQTALLQYRDRDPIAAKAVAILRHGFGAHPLHETVEEKNVGTDDRLPRVRRGSEHHAR